MRMAKKKEKEVSKKGGEPNLEKSLACGDEKILEKGMGREKKGWGLL